MLEKTIAIALGAGLALAAAPGLAETATLKVGSFAGANTSPVKDGYEPWLEAVERDSDGTLKFQRFWGGSLVRAPNKQYEAMINGIQDSVVVLPMYTEKLFPDFAVLTLPFLFHSGTEAAWVEWKMHEMGLWDDTGKMYISATYSNDVAGIHFNVKIGSAEGIEGKKVRVSGPGEAEMLKALGIVPVGMSIAQVPEALNRGVIQGTKNGWSANPVFHITELTKTHLDWPLGALPFLRAINKKVYDKLPAKARAAIDKNSGLEESLRMAKLYDGQGQQLRDEAEADPNRNVLTLTPAELKAKEKLFEPFYRDWIERVQNGQKKWDAIQKLLAEYRKSS